MGVTFPTLVTLVWFLPRVAALVDDEVLQEPTALATVRAAVRFLPCVYHLVFLQVVPAAEGL